MAADWPKVEKGIPLPPEKGQTGLKSFIRSLQPGDSFVEFYARRHSLRGYAKECGFRLAVRKVEGGEGHARYWRIDSAKASPNFKPRAVK